VSPAGLAGSAALHAAIILSAFFTWQHTLKIVDESPPIVPVELVTIAPKTNIRATVKPPPKIEPREDKFATPPPVEATPPPPIPKPEEPAPEPAPAPPVVKPEPKPKPVHKVKPKPKEEKPKKKFDINNIEALLNKVAPKQEKSNAKVADRTIKGIGAQNAMTMDLVDSLRNQIAQCWSPPAGAPHPEDLIVDFFVQLNPDGSVATATPRTQPRNSYVRAAIEAARRAIFTCQPYKLPADRYSQWHEIDPLHFDPRQMMGH
jgi:outer membrane biosynthesis protein TonB